MKNMALVIIACLLLAGMAIGSISYFILRDDPEDDI